MENLHLIQSYKFDQRPAGIESWVFDMLIPGKDHIDIIFDKIHNNFIYAYRGQSEFDVATTKIPNFTEKMTEEGEIEIVSTLKENRFVGGDVLICTLEDKARGVIITIFKGASSGGIDVSLK